MVDEILVNFLVNKFDTEGENVRFGTEKLDPGFEPYPDVQVIIYCPENNTSIRAFQKNMAVTKNAFCIVNVYSKSKQLAAYVAEKVNEFVNSNHVAGTRLVSVNEWQRQVAYSQEEYNYYSNWEIII